MALTLTDVAVAKVIYPILLDLARSGRTTTYGELVAEAKARHPDNAVVAALIPRALGRRLLVVRGFTEDLGYPDLSSLVVNSGTGEVGDAYSEEFDPVEKRAEVMAFDWTNVIAEFDMYVERHEREIASRRRPRRTREEAKQILWQHSIANPKGPLPAAHQRDAVYILLMGGEEVTDAIASVIG